MIEFPPAVLVETWLHVLSSKEKNISRQKKETTEKIIKHFGSIELAKLHVEQFKDEEIEIHFL